MILFTCFLFCFSAQTRSIESHNNFGTWMLGYWLSFALMEVILLPLHVSFLDILILFLCLLCCSNPGHNPVSEKTHKLGENTKDRIILCCCVFVLRFFLMIFWLCVCFHACACVTACIFWVMGFVHAPLLTAWMYPWQRQVDPSCKQSRREGLEREC